MWTVEYSTQASPYNDCLKAYLYYTAQNTVTINKVEYPIKDQVGDFARKH